MPNLHFNRPERLVRIPNDRIDTDGHNGDPPQPPTKLRPQNIPQIIPVEPGRFNEIHRLFIVTQHNVYGKKSTLEKRKKNNLSDNITRFTNMRKDVQHFSEFFVSRQTPTRPQDVEYQLVRGVRIFLLEIWKAMHQKSRSFPP